MNTGPFRATCHVLAFVLSVSAYASAADLKPIALPAPQTDGGKPLMQVLRNRKSSRSFSNKPLPAQVMSNLLWAAFGVNRPDSGKRTAPSARNWQEIDIYVATAQGLYRYDAAGHALEPRLARDVRAETGKQDYVAQAAVNLVYVADLSKMGNATADSKTLCSAADTGFIAQNVYLYCASDGLATVVRGLVDRDALGKLMSLKPDQKIILAQSVGYPSQAR